MTSKLLLSRIVIFMSACSMWGKTAPLLPEAKMKPMAAHFTDEETKAERRPVSCQGSMQRSWFLSPSWHSTEPVFCQAPSRREAASSLVSTESLSPSRWGIFRITLEQERWLRS